MPRDKRPGLPPLLKRAEEAVGKNELPSFLKTDPLPGEVKVPRQVVLHPYPEAPLDLPDGIPQPELLRAMDASDFLIDMVTSLRTARATCAEAYRLGVEQARANAFQGSYGPNEMQFVMHPDTSNPFDGTTIPGSS